MKQAFETVDDLISDNAWLERLTLERQNFTTEGALGTELDESYQEALWRQKEVKRLIKAGALPEQFKRAEALLQAGASLPEPRKTVGDFETKGHYFYYLAGNARELFIALHQNPSIITEQDEIGATLLHHFVIKTIDLDEEDTPLILLQLLNAEGVNFSIQDNHSYTPVHLAILQSNRPVIYDDILPAYVQAAATSGFDFSLKTKEGHTALHLAAFFDENFGCRRSNNRNCVGTLLQHAPGKIDINALSGEGATAFFYALNSLKLGAVRTLLNAGADPYHYGNKDYNPMLRLGLFEAGIPSNKHPLMGYYEDYSDNMERIHKNPSFLKETSRHYRSVMDNAIRKRDPLTLQSIRALPKEIAKETLDKLPNELLQKIAERRPEISHAQKILAERQAQTEEKGQGPTV